jgi:prolyl-tRNA editing enzyme YbaK/EbsC (Cys-tRNA(Pro) deacylase)
VNHDTKLEELETLLKAAQADYSVLKTDITVKSAAEGAAALGISLGETTPTLIIKINSDHIAAIICGDTRLSFKKLKQSLGIKDATLANPETVLKITGAQIGDVCLINPGLKTIIDSNVSKNKYCYGGCGIPKATLRIDTHDLIRITNAQILDVAEARSS